MSKVRVMAVDPGTNTLGLSVHEANIETGQLIVLDAYTVNVPRIAGIYKSVELETLDEKVAKLEAIEYSIANYARSWEVTYAVSESPYMGKFPAAYGALVSCINAIRKGCIFYDSALNLEIIDPSTVKKSLGVPGNSGDKSLIDTAILVNKSINTSNIDYKVLDEHSKDSIAVGYAFLKLFLMG